MFRASASDVFEGSEKAKTLMITSAPTATATIDVMRARAMPRPAITTPAPRISQGTTVVLMLFAGIATAE